MTIKKIKLNKKKKKLIELWYRNFNYFTKGHNPIGHIVHLGIERYTHAIFSIGKTVLRVLKLKKRYKETLISCVNLESEFKKRIQRKL